MHRDKKFEQANMLLALVISNSGEELKNHKWAKKNKTTQESQFYDRILEIHKQLNIKVPNKGQIQKNRKNFYTNYISQAIKSQLKHIQKLSKIYQQENSQIKIEPLLNTFNKNKINIESQNTYKAINEDSMKQLKSIKSLLNEILKGTNIHALRNQIKNKPEISQEIAQILCQMCSNKQQILKIKEFCTHQLGTKEKQRNYSEVLSEHFQYLKLIKQALSQAEQFLPIKTPSLKKQNDLYFIWLKIACLVSHYKQILERQQQQIFQQIIPEQKKICDEVAFLNKTIKQANNKLIKNQHHFRLKLQQLQLLNEELLKQNQDLKVSQRFDLKSKESILKEQQEQNFGKQEQKFKEVSQKYEKLQEMYKELSQQNKILNQKNNELLEQQKSLKKQFEKLVENNNLLQRKFQAIKVNQKFDQMLHGGNIFSLSTCQPQVLEKKYNILRQIQQLSSKEILQTQLIYHYPLFNKGDINFHKYFDDIPNIILFVELQDSHQIIGGFSMNPFSKKNEPDVQKGILFNLNRDKIYFKRNDKVTIYNEFYIVFGNSQLRIKNNQSQIYSNFGITNKFFDTGADTLQEFWGSKSETLSLAKYQIHRIIFKEQ